MASSPRYTIEYHITSINEEDDEADVKVRRNGKIFYIQISPSNFENSPAMAKKYLEYLEVLRSGEEVVGDIYETDVFDWVMRPFEQLLVELAPPPPGNPADIRITLQQHLLPEVFTFNLEIIDEKLIPRRIFPREPPFRPSFCFFDDSFLDDLETWTRVYDPAGIILSFEAPEDALFKEPRKVLIDNGQVIYKAIGAAGLYDSQLNLCRVHGVVMDDCDFILGILLSHIDCADRPLSTRVLPDDPNDPPSDVRGRWMQQLDASLSALHKAGIVWGDVKSENVLIDRNSNAWVTDFGGGYTEGWVDKELAETTEGDEMGMEKIQVQISRQFDALGFARSSRPPKPHPRDVLTATPGTEDHLKSFG
ncbi:hypothetical protein NLG97_g7083 [Lecanicillium saksenae]|uniref:Uncharacterized protein n=1 Tax=Lecanicillium saksenae TaxID=468837 RepID=A0ACC1QPH5_9HYPO|nr:hypothetical protein NLG97_g7083 [Lecanicillium saksenae]